MVDKEPNGKGAEKPLVRETDPKATDWSAGATARALPILGGVTKMAERQRERDAPPLQGGTTFTVSIAEVFKFGAALLAVGAVWWSLKSDLRDMRTTMEFQTTMQKERWEAQVKTNESATREMRMLTLTVDDIEKALIRAGIDVDGAEVRIHGREPGGAGR